ncbi:MAG TPA: nitroreductase family protein [Phycisphaerae bacterium]|nr:nitroreductase family protein [Phycisphaerae bacterium]
MSAPTLADAIRKRVSCRTYDDRVPDEETKRTLKDFFRENSRGPFGNALRFELIDLTEAERAELKTLGTYGVIRGAALYIAGAVRKGPRALEDYGYGMERNILYATSLGLGTCWLGGTLNRAGFARKIALAENELMPAISPVGCPAQKRTLTDRVFRFMAKSDRRKPWEDLFFDGRPGNPLTREQAGPFAEALEAVRIGPSASNRQPWRVVREGAAWHFFLQRTPGYDKMTGEVKLQDVDMGIALCHFELAVSEPGIGGSWQQAKPGFDAGTWEHVTSWVTGEGRRAHDIAGQAV